MLEVCGCEVPSRGLCLHDASGFTSSGTSHTIRFTCCVSYNTANPPRTSPARVATHTNPTLSLVKHINSRKLPKPDTVKLSVESSAMSGSPNGTVARSAHMQSTDRQAATTQDIDAEEAQDRGDGAPSASTGNATATRSDVASNATDIEIPDFMKSKKKQPAWTEEQRHALHMLKTRFDLNMVARRDVFNLIFQDELGPEGRNTKALESRYGMRTKQVKAWRPVLEPTEESRELRESVMRRIREAIGEVTRKHAASQNAAKVEGKSELGPVVVREDAAEQPAAPSKSSVPSRTPDTAHGHDSQVEAVSSRVPPSGWFSTNERIEAVPRYFDTLNRRPEGRKALQGLSASELNARDGDKMNGSPMTPDGKGGTTKLPALLSPSKQGDRSPQLPKLASILEKAVAEQARGDASGREK